MVSSQTRVILALVIGLFAGAALRAVPASALATAADAIEPIGTLWVNGIRMTVIPLVVSLLIVGIAAPRDAARIGRVGAYALGVFLALLGIVALISTFVTPAVFARLELDPAGVAVLRAQVQSTGVPQAIPTTTDWLIGLVPSNPVRAAADGALLSVIVFAVAFAFAVLRIPDPQRASVVGFFRGLGDATLVLVTWVVALAPIGVFALALALGRRVGIDAFGAVGFYIGFVCVFNAITALAMYPLATVIGRIPLSEFARAVAPAQVIAFSTRSSLAALPVLIRGATDRLRLSPTITGFVIPLAVSIFKLTSPTYWPAGALFVASLYGVELGLAQIALVAFASVVLGLSAPGIPGGGLFIQAPVYLAIGLPVEGLGILLAIDLIPDIFKTTLNVTAQMAAATIVARLARSDQVAGVATE